MSFAPATPITDFQRQHRRNVETGCRGGTEGGEVTAEECCVAPRNGGSLTDTGGQPAPQVRPYGSPDLPDSQADSAGSIPVTRSGSASPKPGVHSRGSGNVGGAEAGAGPLGTHQVALESAQKMRAGCSRPGIGVRRPTSTPPPSLMIGQPLASSTASAKSLAVTSV